MVQTLTEIISSKYTSRKVESHDPRPIRVSCDEVGPLLIRKGFLLCECGSIIRQSYYKEHKSSGACSRLATKRNIKPITRQYGGPYVHMERDFS